MSPDSRVCRTHMVVCGGILALTLAGKSVALLHGGDLLKEAHSFLPGTYGLYVWVGLVLECAALAVLWARATRLFLMVCLGLGILFVGYHAVEVGLAVNAPCPCLGGLLGSWEPLARMESTISFMLAAALATSAFLGLAPRQPQVLSDTTTHQDQPSVGGWGVGLWLCLGAAILLFWSGHVLGGDESMEAAKSLQYLRDPAAAARMWNDQPPLSSYIGAGIFGVFGPSLTAGRAVIILIGTLLPLVWGIYCSRIGVRWGAVFAVVLLWLAMPSHFASFMLEAPAYAIGIGALLPLLLMRRQRAAWMLSALIGALALSIKLTAAFALVVPFVYLVQTARQRAIVWGTAVVLLTVAGSFLQPGWFWGTMGASHLAAPAREALEYRFTPAAYVSNWLVCLLALFALAARYLNSQMQSILPWVAAAGAALLIHMFHLPYWDYYVVHLMTPVVVLAGIGMVDLLQAARETKLPLWGRRSIWTLGLILCGLWGWQKFATILESREGALPYAHSPVTEQLRALTAPGRTMFSMDPLWTFAAGQVQTPRDLTIIPKKRLWSGEITHEMIVGLLASNRVDALVVYQTTLNMPAWTNLLAGYLPTARERRHILFVRRELDPKPIDLPETSETAFDLKRLGL